MSGQQKSMGPGLDAIAARSQEIAREAAQRVAAPQPRPAAPAQRPAPRAPARPAPSAEEMFNMAQKRSAAYDRMAVEEPELDDLEGEEGDFFGAEEGAPPPQTELTDEAIDDLADELAGKKKKPKPVKYEKSAADAKDPEAARKRALDRLKIPAKVREQIEAMDPEDVDAWLEELVQDQSKTDDAFTERDRKLAELGAKVQALEATGRDPKTGKFTAAKTSNAKSKQGTDPGEDDGDPDEILEELRETDPKIARALESRDAEIRDLKSELRTHKRQSAAVTADFEARQAESARENLRTAIKDLQDELAEMYPQLNDLNHVRAYVAPRARALVTSGVATDIASALREAAHAAFGTMVVEDRAALAARAAPTGKQVVRASQGDPPRKRATSTVSQANTIYVKLREEHPDWTEARVRKLARERAGRVVADPPYIRN